MNHHIISVTRGHNERHPVSTHSYVDDEVAVAGTTESRRKLFRPVSSGAHTTLYVPSRRAPHRRRSCWPSCLCSCTVYAHSSRLAVECSRRAPCQVSSRVAASPQAPVAHSRKVPAAPRRWLRPARPRPAGAALRPPLSPLQAFISTPPGAPGSHRRRRPSCTAQEERVAPAGPARASHEPAVQNHDALRLDSVHHLPRCSGEKNRNGRVSLSSGGGRRAGSALAHGPGV